MGRWDVFFSYSRKDGARAAAIVEALRAAGLRVWFDRSEIEEFERLFAFGLGDGLAEVRCFCLLGSANAAESVWVEKEIGNFLLGVKQGGSSALHVLHDGMPEFEERWRRIVQQRAYGEEIDLHFHSLSDDRLPEIVAAIRHAATPPRAALDPAGDLDQRAQRAEAFWAANNIMARYGWRSLDWPALFRRLDRFAPPYPFPFPSDEQIVAVLDGIVEGEPDNVVLSNRRAARAVIEVFDEPDLLIGIAHRGSPVVLLHSMAMETNIAHDLQASYYDVRSRFVDRPACDLLDLTVILGAGVTVDRWMRESVRAEPIIEALLALTPLYEAPLN